LPRGRGLIRKRGFAPLKHPGDGAQDKESAGRSGMSMVMIAGAVVVIIIIILIIWALMK